MTALVNDLGEQNELSQDKPEIRPSYLVHD